jgi:tRNA(fMet)-specific endonuclease VapC
VAFILDTNVAIDLRDGVEAIMDKVEALSDGVLLSIVTRVELEGGVVREPTQADRRRQRLDALLSGVVILAFDEACADAYRTIVETAGYSRRKLLDRMIAAQALAHRATLVTRNAQDFRDIPGLELLEW